jgi:hypothetical protein
MVGNIATLTYAPKPFRIEGSILKRETALLKVFRHNNKPPTEAEIPSFKKRDQPLSVSPETKGAHR